MGQSALCGLPFLHFAVEMKKISKIMNYIQSHDDA